MMQRKCLIKNKRSKAFDTQKFIKPAYKCKEMVCTDELKHDIKYTSVLRMLVEIQLEVWPPNSRYKVQNVINK